MNRWPLFTNHTLLLPRQQRGQLSACFKYVDIGGTNLARNPTNFQYILIVRNEGKQEGNLHVPYFVGKLKWKY